MIGSIKPNLDKNVNLASVCITSKSCDAYQQSIQNKTCFIEVIKIYNKYFYVYTELEITKMGLKNILMIKY